MLQKCGQHEATHTNAYNENLFGTRWELQNIGSLNCVPNSRILIDKPPLDWGKPMQNPSSPIKKSTDNHVVNVNEVPYVLKIAASTKHPCTPANTHTHTRTHTQRHTHTLTDTDSKSGALLVPHDSRVEDFLVVVPRARVQQGSSYQ